MMKILANLQNVGLVRIIILMMVLREEILVTSLENIETLIIEIVISRLN